MKQVVIIDDEEKSRLTLSSFIDKYCPGLQIAGQADGVQSGVNLIETTKPDVVFLDIEMNDGTGFDVIEALPERDFDVIFVTAYNQYALKAFRYSAVDYLLKPINPEELVQAVHKLSGTERIDQIEKKLEALIANKNRLEKIAFPSMEGVRLENVKDIIYCESDNYYTIVHFTNDEKITVSKTLKEYDQMLSEEDFFRIHQKFLVNLSHLKNFSKSDGGFVTLSNGKELSVARRKKEELLRLLTN